jgi:hypothetical protein
MESASLREKNIALRTTRSTSRSLAAFLFVPSQLISGLKYSIIARVEMSRQ